MKTELIIPEASGKVAEIIPEEQRLKIGSMVPAVVDTYQFMLSLYSAVNQLDRPCDPTSIKIAAFNSAQLGLMPGANIGHAYFVPFKGKCQLVIGYQGFIHLGYSTSFLSKVYAEVITSEEEPSFQQWVDETGPKLRHNLTLNRNLARENIIGAYCVYTTKDGQTGYQVVTKSELNEIDTGKNVWKSNYKEMAKKTAIRRAAKFWNKTARLSQAITLDEQAERGAVQSDLTEQVKDEPRMSLDDFGEET